jgi:hypothetical protein
MGFRQGAANVFSNELAPKAPTLGEVGNLGQLMHSVQQDKANNQQKQKDLTVTVYQKLADLFGNADKLTPQQKKLLAVPITGMANNVLGYNWDPDLIATTLGDEQQSIGFSKSFQNLIDSQGTENEGAATELLAGAGANVEQLTEAIKFAQTQETANKPKPPKALGPLDIPKFIISLDNNIRNTAKVPIKVIKEANKLIGLSTDEQSGFTATAAISVFARLVDPDSSVRVQEAANIAGIAPGVMEEAKTNLATLISGQRLKPRAWKQMKQAAAVMALIENQELEKIKNSVRETTKGIPDFDVEGQVLNKLPVPSASLMELMNSENQRQDTAKTKADQSRAHSVDAIRQTKPRPVKPDQMARGRNLILRGKNPETVIKFLELNGPMPEAQKNILRKGAK